MEERTPLVKEHRFDTLTEMSENIGSHYSQHLEDNFVKNTGGSTPFRKLFQVKVTSFNVRKCCKNSGVFYRSFFYIEIIL